MCGRYVLELKNWNDYQAAMASLTLDTSRVPPSFANYNITPSSLKPETFVPIIRQANDGAECVMTYWGLIPFFAKGEPTKYSTINAKVETIETAASYRGPWKRGQRCLIPASGFYEWQLLPDMKTVVPNYIHLADQPHFGFAGLWDRSVSADDKAIESCTIITMPANTLMAEIHNSQTIKGKRVLRSAEGRRMPAILHAKDWTKWLTGTAEEVMPLLTQYPDDVMVAWPVSPRVNSPRNNGPELIQSVG